MRVGIAPAALVAFLFAAAPAYAGRVTVPVHVQVAVPDSCRVVSPEKVALDGSGKPDLRADTLIGGCIGQPVRPLLSVRADALENGVYIATLDF